MSAFERCPVCGCLGLLVWRNGELEAHRPNRPGYRFEDGCCPNKAPTALDRRTK